MKNITVSCVQMASYTATNAKNKTHEPLKTSFTNSDVLFTLKNNNTMTDHDLNWPNDWPKMLSTLNSIELVCVSAGSLER